MKAFIMIYIAEKLLKGKGNDTNLANFQITIYRLLNEFFKKSSYEFYDFTEKKTK